MHVRGISTCVTFWCAVMPPKGAARGNKNEGPKGPLDSQPKASSEFDYPPTIPASIAHRLMSRLCSVGLLVEVVDCSGYLRRVFGCWRIWYPISGYQSRSGWAS